MGGTTSSAYLNQLLDASIDIMQTTNNLCMTYQNQSNIAIFTEGCDIKNSIIKQEGGYEVSNTCLSDITMDATLNQQVVNNAQQMAEAESVGMGLSKTASEDFINQSITCATSVVQQFTQVASDVSTSSNTILCKGGKVTNSIITQSTRMSIINTSKQNVKTTVSASQTIDNTVSQTATAKHKSLLVAIIDAIAVVLMAVGMVFVAVAFGGTKIFANPFLLMLAIIGIVAFIYFWCSIEWWPFKNTDHGNNLTSKAYNDNIMKWVYLIGGIGIVGTGLWGYSTLQKPAKPPKP